MCVQQENVADELPNTVPAKCILCAYLLRSSGMCVQKHISTSRLLVTVHVD